MFRLRSPFTRLEDDNMLVWCACFYVLPSFSLLFWTVIILTNGFCRVGNPTYALVNNTTQGKGDLYGLSDLPLQALFPQILPACFWFSKFFL